VIALDCFVVMRRNGDIFMVAVDPEDYERVMAAGPWRMQPHRKTCYAFRSIYSSSGRLTSQYLHNFILSTNGIDHIDGNGLNNRKANLRLATNVENNQNRIGLYNTNKSGFRGVSFCKRDGKWQAKIGLNGRNHHIGYFATAVEAGIAASKARSRWMPFSADARGSR